MERKDRARGEIATPTARATAERRRNVRMIQYAESAAADDMSEKIGRSATSNTFAMP